MNIDIASLNDRKIKKTEQNRMIPRKHTEHLTLLKPFNASRSHDCCAWSYDRL